MDSTKIVYERFKSQTAWLLAVLICMFLIELVDGLMPGQHPLDQWGVRPRELTGLVGIPLAPFLHGSFNHLAENSLPFFVLAWLTLLGGVRRFLFVSMGITLISGLGVWIFGMPNTVHIGLSGVIFGYLGYLLARGWYERKLPAIVIALVVGITYLGMLTQLVSVKAHISWTAHGFGFLGGIVMAALLFQKPARPAATELS